MKFSQTLFAAAAALALTTVAANAGQRVGVLECALSGNPARVIVENQAVDCVYQDDAEGGRPVHYVGRLTKVGANLSVNGRGDILWIVAAATNQLGPGALEGVYAGPEASVKLGVGGGGAVLIGGSNNTVSLQPLTVEGGQGLGVTAGIERLELQYIPDSPPRRMRHHRYGLH